MVLFERRDQHITHNDRPGKIGRRAGWWIELRAFEGIIKALSEDRPSRGRGKAPHRLTHSMKNLPQIVDAMGMVSMVMCQEHRVEVRHASGQ
jgi:hypothetical protein